MRILATLLLTAGLALAQLDSDTITIVARSQSTTVPPGSVSVNLQVQAPLGTALDDVLAVVSGLGLTERDLLGVDSAGLNACFQFVETTCTATLTWQFQFTAPVAGLKETLSKLARTGAPKSGVSVSYSVYSANTSAAPDCAYPTLISQARRYAENVAAAAGVRVGRVVALSDSPADVAGIPTAAIRVGDFSQIIPVTGFVSFLLGPPAPVIATTCGVSVQYQLLR